MTATSSANADVLALLEENKQLKAILILHLNLIQEQSDLLITKENILETQTEELKRLSASNKELENKIVELQKQLQRQIKRVGSFSALSPPPLAKIQHKPKTTVAALLTTTTTTSSLQTISSTVTENEGGEDKEIDENIKDDSNEENGDHEVNDRSDEGSTKTTYDKCLTKKRRSVNVKNLKDAGNSTKVSSEVLAVQSKRLRLWQVNKLPLPVLRGTKPANTITPTIKFKPVTSKTTHAVSATTPIPSRGKHLPLMRWHTHDFPTDESVSCDSTAASGRRPISVTSALSPKNHSGLANDNKSYSSLTTLLHFHTHNTQTRLNRTKHCYYISTSQLYCCREWENDTFAAGNNYEFIKAEAKALVVDPPMLEIPKWTENELTPSYCNKGIEDLSNDKYLKLHAKLEILEKRRKKWDVQQIKESQRIERLKRRQCNEIPASQEPPILQSFYPGSDTVQTIQYVKDLPVQAFGEMIPCLDAITVEQANFRLPWLYKDLPAIYETTISAADRLLALSAPVVPKNTFNQPIRQQMLNSAFVFLKNRKQQQSFSVTVTTPSR